MLSVTYVSSATRLMDTAALIELLNAARAKNESAGLTGMLLYRDGNIIQALEGPDEAVESTFRQISRDPRHKGLILLLREEISERRFPDWSMGFHDATGAQMDEVAGYADFLDRDLGEIPDDVAPAVRLLWSFRVNMR